MSNIASRLHELLKSGTQIKERNRPASEAWAQLLGIPHENQADLLRQIGSVMQLQADIRDRVVSSGASNPDLLLRWTGKVDMAFQAMSPRGPWSRFIEPIDGETLLALEFCAAFLETTCPDPECDYDELVKLQKKANALTDELAKSSLPSELKGFLTEQLERVVSALRNIRIFGPNAAKDAALASLLEMALKHEQSAEAARHTLGKKVIEVIKILAISVGLTNGLMQLPEGFRKLLDQVSQ